MKDKNKSKEQLVDELVKLRGRVAELEKMKSRYLSAEKVTTRVEEALRESEEKYRMLTESVLEGILITDFKGKVLYCNEAAAKMVGYEKAEDGIGKNVFSFIAPESRKIAFKDLLRVYMGDWGFLATYKAMTKDGERFWVETIGRKIAYQGRSAEVIAFRDITERRRMQEELQKAKEKLEVKVEERTSELRIALEKLQRLLEEGVSSLASAVEAKDPYTAGHQQRVAQLACAIAEEMGLSEGQVDGIYMGAIVHDVGKIHVPAEILTKPDKLNEIELEMIRSHSQFGYNILKEIEFPWPVAKAVLQHHERMDGSGYPSGISGEDILLEARVLAVADVVEAISTHRPYRAAKGIDKALEEISQNKGILYDASVVDACMKLFTKKRFKFKKK